MPKRLIIPKRTEASDWSRQVHESVREIVRTTACPTCGMRAGLPCKNVVAELFPERGTRKRNPRNFYTHHVHRPRRKLWQDVHAPRRKRPPARSARSPRKVTTAAPISVPTASPATSTRSPRAEHPSNVGEPILGDGEG